MLASCLYCLENKFRRKIVQTCQTTKQKWRCAFSEYFYFFIVTCISAARSRRLYCSCLVEGAGCLLQGAGVAVKLVVGIYIVIG